MQIVSVISLGKIYYPKYSVVFTSLSKLVKTSKNKRRDIEEWLSVQDAYTLLKAVRKWFPRNPYTVSNIDYVWEIELADLNSLSKYNDKHKFIVNVIDTFSRHVWSVLLKDKTASSRLQL